MKTPMRDTGLPHKSYDGMLTLIGGFGIAEYENDGELLAMTGRHLGRIAVFLMALLLCIPAIPAGAAGAASVWVNGLELTSFTPYLGSGDNTPSAFKPVSGGYAYMDYEASRLTLYDMRLDTFHTHSTKYATFHSAVFADGDLEVVLAGENFLRKTVSDPNVFTGIYAQGLLTVTGNGRLDIRMDSANDETYPYGIICDYMKIENGTLDVQLSGTSQVCGLISYNDILISGGSTTVRCSGGRLGAAIMASGGSFSMSGGRVTATANTSAGTKGLYCGDMILTGGEGFFSGYGADDSEGGYLNAYFETLSVTGGHFVFKGSTAALLTYINTFEMDLLRVQTYVSADGGGSGKSLWTSVADGQLIDTLWVTSPFHYVEFIGPHWYWHAVPPQTSDGMCPWLWAVIAACALIVAAAGVRAAARL